MNPIILYWLTSALAVAISSAVWYYIGKRRGDTDGYRRGYSFGEELGDESGYRRGYKAGKAQGWSDRHFEQIAKERKIRDKRTGRYKAYKKNA
jgi:membrane protein DedA with SNARE-associated domain